MSGCLGFVRSTVPFACLGFVYGFWSCRFFLPHGTCRSLTFSIHKFSRICICVWSILSCIYVKRPYKVSHAVLGSRRGKLVRRWHFRREALMGGNSLTLCSLNALFCKGCHMQIERQCGYLVEIVNWRMLHLQSSFFRDIRICRHGWIFNAQFALFLFSALSSSLLRFSDGVFGYNVISHIASRN